MDRDLENRRVLLVISGGIAAYKVGFAVQSLVARGAGVRAVMTHAATKFVGTATFEALTGNAVLTDLFTGGGAVDHVELARWPEVVLVAPATANLLAKMAHGLADDPASTVLLATRAVVVAAPAMNDGMWQHPATQANIKTLKARGLQLLGPATGFLAEGYEAVGRMVEADALVDGVVAALP